MINGVLLFHEWHQRHVTRRKFSVQRRQSHCHKWSLHFITISSLFFHHGLLNSDMGGFLFLIPDAIRWYFNPNGNERISRNINRVSIGQPIDFISCKKRGIWVCAVTCFYQNSCWRRRIPTGIVKPYSTSRERSWLARAVLCSTISWHVFRSALISCCSVVFTETKWISGRSAVSQIARSSLASFFWLRTKAFTCCAGISLTGYPIALNVLPQKWQVEQASIAISIPGSNCRTVSCNLEREIFYSMRRSHHSSRRRPEKQIWQYRYQQLWSHSYDVTPGLMQSVKLWHWLL